MQRPDDRSVSRYTPTYLSARSSDLHSAEGRGLSVDKDAFNYWQSRMRINIECAFGILHARWGVLWRPIELNIHRVPTMMIALVKLHNMCITDCGAAHLPEMDKECIDGIVHWDDAVPGATDQGSVYAGYDEGDSQAGRRRDVEHSERREHLREEFLAHGMQRPLHSSYSYM